MATETFFKRIILSDEAAMRLADGLEKPRPEYVPHFDIDKVLREGDEWLQLKVSDSKSL